MSIGKKALVSSALVLVRTYLESVEVPHVSELEGLPERRREPRPAHP